MSQTENCYWFTGADYVVWIFNYSITATGIPCLRHVRHMASPGYLLHLFQILRGFWQVLCIKSTLYKYILLFWKSTILVKVPFCLSTFLSGQPLFQCEGQRRARRCMRESHYNWGGKTFGDCLIQLSWLHRVTCSSCSGHYLDGALQNRRANLSGKPVPVSDHLQCKKVLFLCWNSISCVLECAHWPLSSHLAPLRWAWLHPPCTLPSGIYAYS